MATAADIMTQPVISVPPEAGIAEIADLLSRHSISAVPVCRADGTLVGLVSEGDILRPFRESVRRRAEWWLGLMAAGEELSQDFLDSIRPDNRTAREMMVQHVVVAEETTTLPQLAELMVKHRIKRLPVLREGRVVGIVSRSDLIRAVSRAPAMLI
jgi:CBS domain-containing protein